MSECTTKFKLYLFSSLHLLIQNDLLVLFLVIYHERKNNVKLLYLCVGGETSSHIRDICVPITPEYIAQAKKNPLIGEEYYKEKHFKEK